MQFNPIMRNDDIFDENNSLLKILLKYIISCLFRNLKSYKTIILKLIINVFYNFKDYILFNFKYNPKNKFLTIFEVSTNHSTQKFEIFISLIFDIFKI